MQHAQIEKCTPRRFCVKQNNQFIILLYCPLKMGGFKIGKKNLGIQNDFIYQWVAFLLKENLAHPIVSLFPPCMSSFGPGVVRSYIIIGRVQDGPVSCIGVRKQNP